MSTHLVLTLAMGDEYQSLARLTHPSIQAYAARIGADFQCITEQKISTTTPHWEKFQIEGLLDQYERILYLDTDLIVRDDCPNLFELVPEGELGMFNEAQFTLRPREMMIQVCKDYNTVLAEWDNRYFNSGVMVISKVHKAIFIKPEEEIFNFYEQSYLNLIIAQSSVPMFCLEYQYNRMACMDRFTGEDRLSSYIVHYAGCPNGGLLPSVITADLSRWAEAQGAYHFPQHIHIMVTGGLGDQVNAEPAIRYMKDHVYPDATIIVTSHWSRLFRHLGLPTFRHEDFTPDPGTAYYVVNTLPAPDTAQWAIVSNLLCHTVDYTSIALMRRILPVEAKRPVLDVGIADLSDLVTVTGFARLDRLILVHAGRHWATKTFPLEWWQAVVDGLARAGHVVCLIGKETTDEPGEPRGVVPIHAPAGSLDLRDKLDIGQLITLIKYAPVLLSNDSAPIHMAGAFENWIILIPSCKHPEHVLPHRYGSVFWQTHQLYKKLPLDDCSSQPTAVHGVSADFPILDWTPYLPGASEVVDCVTRIRRGGKDG